jgi:membrane fusion protein (multidrug efflux system)
VADRYVEVGELVSPGTPVARIVDPFTVKLVGSVTELGVAWVQEGAPAAVTLDGSDGVMEGVVSHVGIEADLLNGKFTVEVEVDNSELRLRAGVVGRARIRKAVHEAVLVIPRDALVQTVDGLRVYVAEGDRAAPRAIELGATQGLMVSVIRGLEAGDRVVVRGQRQLQPGSLIAIQEVATARDGSIAADPPEIREEGSIPEVPAELAGDTEALK